MKLFKLPQDLWWIISQSVSICSIVASCINFNLIAFLISLVIFLMFGFLWFKFIFWPWWKVKKSVQLTYKGIKICYHEPFDAQERVQLKMGIDNIEQKFENKLSVSKVCIIEDAFSNLVAMLVDDINEKYFNARYGTTYSRIEGLASGKLIIVNISNGIETSALRHEIAHVVLSNCSASKSEEAQHEIMKQVGV